MLSRCTKNSSIRNAARTVVTFANPVRSQSPVSRVMTVSPRVVVPRRLYATPPPQVNTRYVLPLNEMFTRDVHLSWWQWAASREISSIFGCNDGASSRVVRKPRGWFGKPGIRSRVQRECIVHILKHIVDQPLRLSYRAVSLPLV